MRLNSEHISAEEIDGELIAINFSTGKYFSLQGTAIEVWNALLAGLSAQDIVTLQEGRCDFSKEYGATEIASFINQLTDEKLLIDGSPEILQPKRAKAVTPWSAPVLEEFDDMTSLLALDPVVDLALEGWPEAPA